MHLIKEQIQYINSFDTDNFISIDTESTGLDRDSDEVVSLGIVDQDGTTLFYELVKPTTHKSWSGAQKVHGISPSMVKNKECLAYYSDEIKAIIDKAPVVVGYNLGYDLDIIANSGIKLYPKRQFDLMREYAYVYGEWADWKQDYLWVKLSEVANHYGYLYHAHNALEDAKATAYCYKAFINDCKHQNTSNTKRVLSSLWFKLKGTLVTAVVLLLFFAFLFAGIGFAQNANTPASIICFLATAVLGFFGWHCIKVLKA